MAFPLYFPQQRSAQTENINLNIMCVINDFAIASSFIIIKAKFSIIRWRVHIQAEILSYCRSIELFLSWINLHKLENLQFYHRTHNDLNVRQNDSSVYNNFSPHSRHYWLSLLTRDLCSLKQCRASERKMSFHIFPPPSATC